MSQPLACTRLRLNLIDWAATVNNPNALPEAGVNGSFFNRQGNGATTPTETYLKLNQTAGFGWVKQNTVNIEILNVRDFGAVGDGVTDDATAIAAAIAAAKAIGGATIYFPPGSWVLGHRTGGPFAVLDLDNVQNVTFMGDGFASKILVIMNAGATDLYTFYIHNGSSNIHFENLYMDGAGITNPDPGEQTHMIFVATATTDTLGGGHDITIDGCYFGTIQGDNIRGLGTLITGVETPVYNVRIEDNAIISPACRSGIAFQRQTHRWIVCDNFLTGSDDQDLDMEPTGTGTPERACITGNQFDHSSKNTAGVTLSGNGATTPSFSSVFAYNLQHNSAGFSGVDMSRWNIHGNIVLYTAPLGGDIGFSTTDTMTESNISANIFDRPNRTTQLFKTIVIFGGLGTRERLYIADNISKNFGDIGGGVGLDVEDTVNDVIFDGNQVEMIDATGNVAVAFRAVTATGDADGIGMIGNLAIATSGTMLAGFVVATNGAFSMGNFLVYANLSRHSGAGVRLGPSGGGSFVDWRGAINHNAIDITGSIVAILTFNNGVTIEGNPGPSSRFLQVAAVPGGAVPSPVGSVSLNTGGVDGTVFWYKEVAASNVDTAGWISQGPNDIVFATQNINSAVTTALFLATGMDQAIAGATEIKWAAPRPGTARNMRLKCVAGVGGGNNTYTLRKNGVNTTVTFLVANTATTGADTTHSVTFVAGDLLSVQVTKSAAGGTAQTFVTISVEQTA